VVVMVSGVPLQWWWQGGGSGPDGGGDCSGNACTDGYGGGLDDGGLVVVRMVVVTVPKLKAIGVSSHVGVRRQRASKQPKVCAWHTQASLFTELQASAAAQLITPPDCTTVISCGNVWTIRVGVFNYLDSGQRW
jgi:hypothetical protein